jgi:4-aminobutyrate aminotransferase-like enzyme
MLEDHLPEPLNRTTALRVLLRAYECPEVTYLADNFPSFWERASGAHVIDADGHDYLDLTAAFAVMGPGYAHPRIVRAGQEQLARLNHGMGDVHPPAIKAEFLRRLVEVNPIKDGKVILSSSGSEAVESAMKTALIATGRARIIAFSGGYHGLGHGALAGTTGALFRAPFYRQLHPFVYHVPHPYDWRAIGGTDETLLAYLDFLLSDPYSGVGDVGAILVEPIQGRGGIRPLTTAFAQGLRTLCDRHGLLLIYDEIFTGFGRTGYWFGADYLGVIPDIACYGKGMTGGFPLSACVGRSELMDRWGTSTGEAVHTSTFLGNPLGCALALATIDVLEQERLVERAMGLGPIIQDFFACHPHPLIHDVRGSGAMWGIELPVSFGGATMGRLMALMLQRGYIILGSGSHGNVISLTPPFVIDPDELRDALHALLTTLDELAQEKRT